MTSIDLSPVFAALACLISIIFTVQLLSKYLKKRRLYELWWSIAIFLYAISSFEEFYAPLYGWSAIGYRIYFFSAISLVTVMAVGQVYMSFSKRVGHIYAAANGIGLILFLVFLLREPLIMSNLQHQTHTVAGNGLSSGSISRILFAPLLDGIGGVVLIVLPLVSWWRSKKAAPLFVGIGAILLSAVGSLTHVGLESFLPLAELIGISIIFYGVKTANISAPDKKLTELKMN